VNRNNQLSLRQPSEITEDESGKFYKSITNDWERDLAVKYIRKAGDIAFTVCLFVPCRAEQPARTQLEAEQHQNISLPRFRHGELR
jgi:HSP90 family molecular chaperone